jgi:hypothetical protein
MLGQQVGKGGFTGPDISFYGYEIVFHVNNSTEK